jgi:hypothetical protein
MGRVRLGLQSNVVEKCLMLRYVVATNSRDYISFRSDGLDHQLLPLLASGNIHHADPFNLQATQLLNVSQLVSR